MNDERHSPAQAHGVPTIHVVPPPPEEPKEKPHHANPNNAGNAPAAQLPKQLPSTRTGRLRHWLKQKITTKEFVIGAVVFVLLLGGAIAFGITNRANAPKHAQQIAKPKPVVPAPIYSPLTGLPVTADQARQTVTGVMIENSDFARPQSGLAEAGIVFEAIAEGGITRFLALYQESNPANIGPIRSVRPYYLQWALGFDAPVAHVGGSPEALQDVKNWHVKDLDQFYNANYYHRISSRAAPHNMYTSMDQLHALEASKGWGTSTFASFPRNKKESPSKTPNATNIDIAISGPDYNVHYAYEAASNSYLRSEGGAPHTDATSGTQLRPKVVIALAMPYSVESDGYHSMYNTIGSGKAYVFQDGIVISGTWQKPNSNTQFTFTDDAGKVIALEPGQTWITAIGSPTNVSYKP